MKLGKKKARPEAVKFKLRNFINPSALPKPPRYFGHDTLIEASEWGMLGNDNAGDCVWAGAAHETMIWNAMSGNKVIFDDKAVLSDYSAVTGYDGTEATDYGTDMKEAASYRRKTGIIDANGVRHKIEAYLSIDPGNLTEHYQATWLFGALGLGIQFPSSAYDQLNKGKVWRLVRKSPVLGGHYIPLVSKRSHINCVTWAQEQGMTLGFFGHYNDESLAYVSKEMLTNNKSPEGFDAEGLLNALNQLG